MPFQPVDYVLVGVTVLVATLGLFRGLSGLFAFLVGTAHALAGAVHGWNGFLACIESPWLRAGAAVVVFIVLFGVVRYAVKLIAGKLLSQPSDSIFGVVVGLLCGGFLLWSLAGNEYLRGYSYLAQEVHAHVR